MCLGPGLLVVKEIVGGSSADDCGMIQPGDILSKVSLSHFPA